MDCTQIAHFDNRVSKLRFVAMFSSPENSGDFDNSPPPPPLPPPPPPTPYTTSPFYHDEEKELADQEGYASNSFYHDEDKEADPEEEEDPEEQHYLAEFLDDLLMDLQDDEDELLYRCPPERIAGSSSSSSCSSCSILNMNIRSLASSHIM